MIRVVFDTNIVISGYLWSGTPRRALNLISEGRAKLVTSEPLIDELKDVINRQKFANRLEIIDKTTDEIISDFLKLAEVVEVEAIPPTITDDPDDDMVLACASSAKADYIVSGDPHLLDHHEFNDVPILTVNAFLERLSQGDQP